MSAPYQILFSSDKDFTVTMNSYPFISYSCSKKTPEGEVNILSKSTISIDEFEKVLEVAPHTVLPEHVLKNNICIRELRTFINEIKPEKRTLQSPLPPDTVGC